MKPLVVACNACNRAEFQIVGDGTIRCRSCGTMFHGLVLRTATDGSRPEPRLTIGCGEQHEVLS